MIGLRRLLPGLRLLLTVSCLLAYAALTSGCQPTPATPAPAPSVVTALEPSPTPPTREWVLVDLPPGASQLQYGAEVYRLVCSACHGDHGQGLTAAWRSTWAPADQNCWQSKCHGPSHPPDGFVLPVAPAISGGQALSGLATAQTLHDLIQISMPWQNPNSLTTRDSWAVTAYLLKLNGINPGAQLGPGTAASIRLGQ